MWRIAVRELHRLRQRKRFVILAVLTPVAYALIFSAVYWNKKLTGIPITIVDQDHSALSRQITDALLASESFALGANSNSADEFVEQARRGISHACFVFPEHFERDIKKGRGAKVAVLVDASNILTGNIALGAAGTVLGTYSVGADIQKTLLQGDAPASAVFETVQPVEDEYRILHNPAFNSNYTNFMLLGFVCIAIQLLTLLLVAPSADGELDGVGLAALRGLARSRSAVIAGKTLAYLAVLLPPCMLAVWLPSLLVQAPMRGSGWLLLAITAWFICVLTVAGIGCAALVRDSLQTNEIFAIFAMPAYLLSGYTWPAFAMPRGLQLIAHSLPLTHYVMALRKITLYGDSLRYLRPELCGLGIWSLIAVALAYAGYWRLRGGSDIAGEELQ